MLQGRPYLNFINSIKSEYTKRVYRRALIRYLQKNKIIKSLEDMLTLPIKDIENQLVDYLLGLKDDGLSSSFVNLNFSALKHYYFMNDVRINKEKIGKFLGEQKRKNTDRGYTTAETRSHSRPLRHSHESCRILLMFYWHEDWRNNSITT